MVVFRDKDCVRADGLDASSWNPNDDSKAISSAAIPSKWIPIDLVKTKRSTMGIKIAAIQQIAVMVKPSFYGMDQRRSGWFRLIGYIWDTSPMISAGTSMRVRSLIAGERGGSCKPNIVTTIAPIIKPNPTPQPIVARNWRNNRGKDV